MYRVLIILLFFSSAIDAQMSPQPKKITEKYFPDPDIEINTPAFQKKKGFTDYEELMSFYKTLQASNGDVMSINFIGTSQKGKEIPQIILDRKNSNSDKIKVWIQAGLHGDEPASMEGVMYLVQQILTNPEYSHLLDELQIAIIPMANIDGAEKVNRYAANGLDLNRDQTKLMAPESVFLKKAFSDYSPEVALDMHEYRPYRRDFTQLSTYGVTNPYDVMFLYSGNLNVPESLRKYTQSRFVAAAKGILEANNLEHHDYFTESKVMGEIQFTQGSINSRSSATSYALTNAVSSLIEIRGVGIGRTSFKRRTYSSFLVMMSYLQTAYDYKGEVKEQLKKASDNQGNAVVTSKREMEVRPLTMIDIETTEKIELQVPLKDAWDAKPGLVRNRPTAYLILPEHQILVDKLEILGLKVEKLNTAREISVEQYIISAYSSDAEKYEQINRQEVSTEIATVTKAFPEGTFIVYMDQPKANLAIEVLEPEATNSFVSFEVLKTELGAELPIYRYMNNEKL